MTFSIKPIALAISSTLLSSSLLSVSAFANNVVDSNANLDDIEVITITHQRHHLGIENNESYAQGKTTEPDLANWLKSVPGANVNSNGPVTGIAQYRGLYGDRISTTLDGQAVIGAGPNAMDTPLSYSTPLIVESMTVYRGIAPISVGINTLGGAIDVKMRKAEAYNNEKLTVNGDLQAGIRSNNEAQTLSSVVNLTQGNIAGLFYGNVQEGENMESGDGKSISPTDFSKRQFGTDLRYFGANSETGFSYHYTDTQDSGTPALPMDIEYIYSHRASVDGNFTLADWQANWLLGYTDADHGMTNFEKRLNNNSEKHRRNNASGITTNFKFTLGKAFTFGELEFGLDGYLAKHDSVITNPNNAMFAVVNFNDVEDDRFGLFAQWQQTFNKTKVQLGVRLKRAELDAGQVSTSMAMMMPMGSEMMGNMNSTMPTMADLAIDLRDNFNNSDHRVNDTNIDIALSTETQLSTDFSLYIGVGVKNRAPAYQELYLWTPMESTGGLADGNTYVGDIDLASETAYQVDVGFTYQTEKVMIAPHLFYQNIDDYIQGTPLGMSDMSAKMMAQMMASDNNPLKFSNVDAKLYGADVNGYYAINDQIQLSAVVSYVRGERRDINDNLYRIAPLNGQLSANYFSDNWSVNMVLVMAAAQKDVSLTNEEQTSAGYGVLNMDAQYYVNNNLTLRFGVDNLLNKEYQNHLGGYNRVKGSDITVMDRLPAQGTSAWAEMTYSF
ncbi:TonB-dependent receptor [Colwellia hornerae]|uniref:TonB-dependent receptor n=1 Tax=Colwellia hornerae TaxID=89402 RepID=A0A5C6Q533_9GAMM|nr:TonB-dependent receptor [Colwellia hornerae]TWX48117.1 TonB-dependent receptor [Colwellia hornerae]TWX55118.1 TonB-dependent receptor [Colwellia hornerae]TWX64014.1 TonB-dependent receptor [Colwellia hornerae]